MIPVVMRCPTSARRNGLQFFDRAPIDDPGETHNADPLYVEVDPAPVLVVPPDALRVLLEKQGKKFRGYEKRFGDVPDRDRASLMALFNLMEAVRSGQERYEEQYLDFLKARAKIVPLKDRVNLLDVLPLEAKRLKGGGAVKMLSSAFKLVSLVTGLMVWWNETTKTLEPGLYAGESFSDALFALLYLSLQSSEGPAICGRCTKRFTRTKTTQIFCSAKCSASQRKARQRSREKESSSHGTHKTR
jgi:hypothetical protein